MSKIMSKIMKYDNTVTLERLINDCDKNIIRSINYIINLDPKVKTKGWEGFEHEKAAVIYDVYIEWYEAVRNWCSTHEEYLTTLGRYNLCKLGDIPLYNHTLRSKILSGKRKTTNPYTKDLFPFLKRIRTEADFKFNELLQVATQYPDLLGPKKIKIYLSNEKGIFKKNTNGELCYPIKAGRWRLLCELRSKLKSGMELANKVWGHGQLYQLSKDIRDINKLFKKNLGVQQNLITRLKTNGYKLNNDDFELVWKE